MKNIFNALDNLAVNYQMTGSKIISPNQKNNDVDYIVLIDNDSLEQYLKGEGWNADFSYKGSTFTSYKKGELNFIVTYDSILYDCFVLATRLAKQLECETKQERVIVFNSVFHSNGYDFNRNKKG